MSALAPAGSPGTVHPWSVSESPAAYVAPPVCPDALLCDGMPDWHKIVWLAVRRVQGRNEWAWAGWEHYADLTGKGKSQVSKAVTALAEAGWLERDLRDRRRVRCTLPAAPPTVAQDETHTSTEAPSMLHRMQREVAQGETPVAHHETPVAQGETPSKALQGSLPTKPSSLSPARDLETGGWAVEAYRRAFPHLSIPVYQIDLMRVKVTDPKAWGEALDFWLANDYRPTSIGKLIEKHNELLTRADSGAANNGKPDRRPGASSRPPARVDAPPGRYDSLIER